MRTIKIALVAVAGFLLGGCLVPSLHPLYHEDDWLRSPILTGEWFDDDGAAWSFVFASDSSYEISYTADGDTSWFSAHLVQLREQLYLDIYPDQLDALSDAYKSHLIAAHTFWLVDDEAEDGDLVLKTLDKDRLRQQLDSGKVKLEYEKLGADDFLLTASTDRLQDFMLNIADDDSAFVEEHLYRQDNSTDSI